MTFLGISKDVTRCDKCGKSRLPRTFVVRDDETGDVLHLGSECAKNALGLEGSSRALAHKIRTAARRERKARREPKLGHIVGEAKGKDEVSRLNNLIRSVMTEDLLKPQYRGSEKHMRGHCYVASEALYHLLGGKDKGWGVRYIQHEGGPHTYLQHESGRIVDPTADQFDTPVPYEHGRPGAFLTNRALPPGASSPPPSARAREVLERLLTEQYVEPGHVSGIDA